MTAKILIVDDENQLRRVLKGALIKQGYIIAEAGSGEVALESLRKERFQLVLLDRNMPGMSGVDCCSEIRKYSDAAIIMLTVRKAEKDRIEALDAGADDYVTKPFSTPELLARIRANLRRVPMASGKESEAVIFGDVRVDLASRQIFVGGNDVRISPKQFEVLQFLIANRNVAIPHAKILQAVWGPHYGNEVEYLHVVVNQLRKRIEPDPSSPRYILTEPWFGYRMRLP
jgi:two-component system, OmpR family, KDP operon response regulator KdpE